MKCMVAFPALRAASGLLGLILLLSSCSVDKHEALEVTKDQKEVSVEIGKKVEILYTDFGKPNVRIVADKAERHATKEPYMEFPDGLELFVYDGNMNVESHLTADYGYAQENQNEMIARKNVEVINVDGDRLNTEELIWNQKEKKIYSNTFVKITTEDEIIYGEGMEANENFTDYVIKNITGTIQIETDETSEDL